MLKKCIFILFAFLAMTSNSSAEHLVGGEIFYKCLGGDEYEITLKVYRDCYTVTGAPFDNPAAIAVYNTAGDLIDNLQAPFTGSNQLEVVINDPCLQAPPDVCVEEAVYTVTTNLPFLAGGYHIVYQRCCRNPTIVNLIEPDAQGSSYYVHIPELALNTCNSSPSFNSFPPLALCTGEELIFDHSATDSDGDLLVYSLCTPFHGGDQLNPAPNPPLPPPYTNISWSPGYTAGFPINAAPQLSIDPTSGLLTGVPTQVGQYVVGVCVEEYRNGELISTNKRDFQFNVVICESNIAAIIPSQESFHEPCDGLEVDFGNSSVNAQYYHWDFGVAGVISDTADIENPTFLFPDTGAYEVRLIANPGFVCADTTIGVVMVYNPVLVEIESSGELCFDVNEVDFLASGQFGSGATFLWEFEDAVPGSSTELNPQGIVFDSVGTYDISVLVTEHICSDEANMSLETYPRPQAYFNGDTLEGCAPLGVLFVDSSLAGTPHESLWDFGDGVNELGERVFHSYTEAGTFDLNLTIWTTEGCVDTATYYVENAVIVWPQPTAELTVDSNIRFIFEPDFIYDGESNAETCELFTGDGSSFVNSIGSCNFEYSYTDTGNYLAIMVFTDARGCVSSDSVWIRVEPEVRFWVPNAFTPNDDRINDTWGPKAFGFKEFELWVYDRWGKMMFHTTDPFENWNGTFKNQSNHEPVLGVYTYRIAARSVKKTYIKEIGHVTILK